VANRYNYFLQGDDQSNSYPTVYSGLTLNSTDTTSGVTGTGGVFSVFATTLQNDGTTAVAVPGPTIWTSGTIKVELAKPGNIGQIIKGAASQTADLLQAQDSTGTVLAKIDAAGKLTVKDTVINGTLTVNGHVITGNSSGTTSVASNANCGTGCTVSISGNDTSGIITVNTGTTPAAGIQATVSFGSAFGTAPKLVITPESLPASSVFPQYHYGSTTTTFDLKSYTALSASVTYKFSYHAEQ
jgi:hypothetical protein